MTKKEFGLVTDTEAASPAVDDSTAVTRWALVIGAVLIALAAFLHFAAWLSLVFPPIFGGWGISQFGRLKPMADAILMFGAFSFVNTGALYLLLPRLTGTTFRDVALARANILWTLLVGIVSVVAVGLGFGDGRSGFEFPLVLDAAYLTTLLVPLWVALRAFRSRTEDSLHPTVWALMGGFLALATALVVANFPLTEATGAWLQVAFGRGLLLWTWALGSGVGIAWYVVPKASGRPLFSRQLAQIVFFSMLVPPMLAGLAGLTFGPVADWAETIGVAFRFSLLVPALAVPAGMMAILTDADGQRFSGSPAVRLALSGSWLLAGGGIATALSGFPYVQSVVGFTTFEDGTTALLVGAATLFAASFVYHCLPEVTDRPIFSSTLAIHHMRLVLWGSGLTALFLWSAGVYTGAGFRSGALAGIWTAVGDGFGEATSGSIPLSMIALLGMALVAAGQIVFMVNVLRSTRDAAPTEASTEVAE